MDGALKFPLKAKMLSSRIFLLITLHSELDRGTDFRRRRRIVCRRIMPGAAEAPVQLTVSKTPPPSVRSGGAQAGSQMAATGEYVQLRLRDEPVHRLPWLSG